MELDSKIDTKKLFQKLDSQNLGYIGSSNLELRNINSRELKFIQSLLVTIYKTPNKIYKYQDFVKLIHEAELN